MRICIPEIDNRVVQEAVKEFPGVEFVGAGSLKEGCRMVREKEVETMISGLDYSSREVLLTYRDNFEVKEEYFSSSFVCERGEEHLVLADGGVNKLPNAGQLLATTVDSAETYARYYGETPRIAMLSYSTKGSGGENPDLAKIYEVVEKVRERHPKWVIDGELQLDAAIDPDVASKKAPDSPLRGRANVLIVPELNTGNILYKALERYGGFTCAGPIIQGFKVPLADLSRGSSVADVAMTIRVMVKLCGSGER